MLMLQQLMRVKQHPSCDRDRARRRMEAFWSGEHRALVMNEA